MIVYVAIQVDPFEDHREFVYGIYSTLEKAKYAVREDRILGQEIYITEREVDAR